MESLLTLVKKRPVVIIFSCLFLFHNPLKAQEVPVTFKIINAKKEPIPFASFEVSKRSDSSKTLRKSADSSGKVVFNLSKNIQYIVRISSVNYLSVEKGITVTGNQTFFSFTAENVPQTLNTVIVTAKRPLMRQEDDKTIVDPENLAAISTNGYEILEKTPGVFVDQDGNVYLNSMTPSVIYINGRDMKMSTADIATMLKNLPPNAISKIEIIRTPSAKYDASTSGGIVNIVLRKGVKLGLTGSLNAGINQGTYGNQFAGFTLNNNNDNKRSYINFNYGKRKSFEEIKTDRLFAVDTMLSQDAYTIYPANSYYLGYGLGYDLGKKWEIDFNGNASLNTSDNNSENDNLIKKISTSQTEADNLNAVTNKGNSFILSNGIEAKLKIDTSGSEWTTDMFYSFANNKNDQAFSTVFTMPSLPSSVGDGSSDNKRNYFFTTSDLKLKMKSRFTFETGIKSSFHLYRNIADYYTGSGSGRIKDDSRTNTFHYTENINAFYLQGSKTFGKDIVIKAGTRIENTNMVGKQKIPFDTSFTIHRTDFFPYVYLSKSIMKIAGYDLKAYLVYRRTISRPVYEQLNPFPKYVDQYVSEIGNPSLRPQFTQNYEANISIDERPIIAVGVNDTKDIFTNVIYQADSNHAVSYKTYDNLGRNKEVYARALGAIPPGKKYFFVVVVQYNHNFYNGLYENQPLQFKKGTWTFFTYHSLKLDKRSQITLSGFTRLDGQLQFYELGPFGALNFGINRQFLDQKLTVTLSANDIFYTNKNNFTINQGSIDASGFRRADTRRFGLNLRYNFGIKRKEKDDDKLQYLDQQDKSN